MKGRIIVLGGDSHTLDYLNKAIISDVSEALESDDDYFDGRCLRDCDWNYDRIFDIAKIFHPESYEDYYFLWSGKRNE